MKKLALFLIAVSAWGQTSINGDRIITGKLDLSSSPAFIPPSVTTDPSGACTNPSAGKPNVVISLASGNLFACLNGSWHLSSGAPGANGQSPNMRGAWSGTQGYNPLDVVSYQGGSWWALAANTNVTPGSNASIWSQVAAMGAAGPAGSTGATGPIGPQGLVGNTGAPGATGPAGSTGATGPIGPQGLVGNTGAPGPTGPIGLTGPAGSTGAAGPIGPQGNTGPAGSTGPAGPAGPTGPSSPALKARGIWSSTTAYAALDSVSYSSSTYVAVAANTNVTPGTNTAIWNYVGAAQTVGVQSNGVLVTSQNTLNFAPPFAATSNQVQSRIDLNCATCEVNTNKGIANGYAPLDSGGHLPAANLNPTVSANALVIGNSVQTADLGGGSLYETFSNGIMFQKTGLTTQGYFGGGLQVLANGFQNNPAGAALTSGAFTDLNNWVANAPQMASITYYNGMLQFLSNTGLTSGNLFSPTNQMSISTAGVQIASKTADPGCTTAAQVGTLWMNTAPNPDALEVCAATPTGYAWLNPAVFNLNNDGANLGTLPPGETPRTVTAKLSDNVDVRDFGAVCNVNSFNTNWHDDTVAIQNALNYVSGIIGSGTVHVPSRPYPGGCAVSSTIIVPNGVRLKGEDMHTAAIVAMSTFPQNSPIVSVGPVCYLNSQGNQSYLDAGLTQPSQPTMRAGLEDITVNANFIAGSTAVASQTMQENSYLHNVAMYQYDKYGFDCQTYGCQNFALDKLYFIGDSNVNLVHLHLSYANSRLNIRDLTLTGAGATSNNIGVLVENSSEASISDIHCEQLIDCVKVDSGSRAEVDNIWGLGVGSIGTPSTHTLVHFTNTSTGGIVHQAVTYGSPVNIQDDLLGQTIVDYSVPLHVSVPGENTISSAPSVKNIFNLLGAASLSVGNLSVENDATGGSVFETFADGMIIQKSSGLAQYGFAGGGLQLLGNGFANDPSWGAIAAGVTTDLGTWQARATTANAIAMQDGSINFFADLNLTPGNTYSPSYQMVITNSGVQMVPRYADPGCASSNVVGRIWVNASVTPNTFAWCTNTGAGYGWQQPVVSIFGRTGNAVVAKTGDYLASQVTNAVDQTQSYTNPTWLASLAWAKLSGTPNIYSSVLSGGTSVTARGALNFTGPISVADDPAKGSSDVSIAQATAATSGYLASGDWSTFSGKASAGACPAGQFQSADNASGGPLCAQVSLANVTGSATKAQQFSTTVYTDQSNTFASGTQDFTGAAHTKPIKSGTLASMPVSCVSGEYYFATDESREALKQCNAAGTFQSSTGIVTNGLIADYWMSNCNGTVGSGTVLPDCSGSGNSATVPSGGNPAWTQQGLTWATALNVPVVLPAAVLSGFNTVQIYADMSIGNNYNNTSQVQAFLSVGSSAILWGNVLASTPLCCGLYGAWVNNPATQEVDPAVGPNLFTYILDNTNDTICIGANCGVSYYTRGGNNPPSRSGSLFLGGNNLSAQMTGTIYRAIFYNRELTPAEVAQNDAAIDGWIKYRGVTRGKYTPPASSNNLICVGDSITQGKGASPACAPSMLTGLSDTFQIYNMGMSGETLANMLTASPKFATGVNPNGKSNIAWIFAGTNDMCVTSNTLTPAQTFQKLIAFSRYMRGQGAKVMVLPMLSRTGSYQGTTCDALHDQYNTLISQNWSSFADAFVYGMQTDPNLTADGAYANATYFQSDGIHPTLAGQQLIAGYVQSEVNNLLTGTLNVAAFREAIVTKTANYTAAMGDSVILCNATGGAVTITLPTAVGIQGRAFQVKKTDASSNSCSLATTSGQLIDGVTSVPLATQYSLKRVESDGANWQVLQ